MSIDRIRYFAAVVETKNLKRAAELVGISPPSMSKAMRVLEAELGCQLIHPDGRGIGITPKGMEVYQRSTALLEEYRNFFQNLKESGKTSPRIRIATFEVFSTYFISTFLGAEKDSSVFLLEKTPGQIEQAILGGLVELGITYLPAPDPALEYIEIGSFEMGIFGLKKWQNSPFQEIPFAVPVTELRIHSSNIDTLDMWPQKAPKRKIKFELELLETSLQVARQGLCVLHCPDFIVRLHNEQIRNEFQLTRLALPDGYRKAKPTKIFLVGKKGAIPTYLERKMAKCLRGLA